MHGRTRGVRHGAIPIRTGLTKVGLPGWNIRLQPEDPSVADFMKNLGYATGQFGKNHLGDLNKFLPTVPGFDEFFGNLYHLNCAELTAPSCFIAAVTTGQLSCVSNAAVSAPASEFLPFSLKAFAR